MGKLYIAHGHGEAGLISVRYFATKMERDAWVRANRQLGCRYYDGGFRLLK